MDNQKPRSEKSLIGIRIFVIVDKNGNLFDKRALIRNLDKSDLKVSALHTQHFVTNLVNRSVQLDVVATDAQNKTYNDEGNLSTEVIARCCDLSIEEVEELKKKKAS